jgi:hypothetical protein
VFPADAGELGPADQVREVLAGVDVADVDFLPVAAADGDAVGKKLAVEAVRLRLQGDGAVGAERVGVEHDRRLAAEFVQAADNVLVLQAVVLLEEVPVPLAVRQRVFGIVPELGQFRVDAVPHRPVDERARQGVFSIDPRLGLLGIGILEPAVRIGDFHPVKVVRGIAARGRRVLERSGVGRASRRPRALPADGSKCQEETSCRRKKRRAASNSH